MLVSDVEHWAYCMPQLIVADCLPVLCASLLVG